MDLHILHTAPCYHFFLPGYPLSRSVSNARYVTSRVPAYKEVKDVWKCSCRSNVYIYIHVYSLPLAFFAILYLSLPTLALVINCFSIFLLFLYQGSVPAEGIILDIARTLFSFPSRGLLLFSFTRNQTLSYKRKYIANFNTKQNVVVYLHTRKD